MSHYQRKFAPLALAVAGVALMALSTACATDTRGWIETNEELVAADPGFYALSKERRVVGWMPWPEDYEHNGCGFVEAAIHITPTDIWIGTSIGDRWQITNTSKGRDWQSLARVLGEFRESPRWEYHPYIQLAADDSIAYGEILTTVDLAVAAEFTEISYREPANLGIHFASL
jgi:hypothetical protein